MELLSQPHKMVEVTGFEPATSASRTQRSTKLSHASIRVKNSFVLHNNNHYIETLSKCQASFKTFCETPEWLEFKKRTAPPRRPLIIGLCPDQPT